MEHDEFIQAVFERLPSLEPDDKAHITALVSRFFHKGWTLEDAIAYCRCTEEVNPTLDEDIALTRMNVLSLKYKNKETAYWSKLNDEGSAFEEITTIINKL